MAQSSNKLNIQAVHVGNEFDKGLLTEALPNRFDDKKFLYALPFSQPRERHEFQQQKYILRPVRFWSITENPQRPRAMGFPGKVDALAQSIHIVRVGCGKLADVIPSIPGKPEVSEIAVQLKYDRVIHEQLGQAAFGRHACEADLPAPVTGVNPAETVEGVDPTVGSDFGDALPRASDIDVAVNGVESHFLKCVCHGVTGSFVKNSPRGLLLREVKVRIEGF